MKKSTFLSFLLFLFGAFALTGLASTLLWLRRPAEGSLNRPALLLAVAVVCLATLVNLLIRWLRWHFLLRTFAVRLRARSSLAVFSSLLPMVFTPWAAGEILLFPMLRRHTSRPLMVAVMVWLLSRAADAGALLLLTSLWSASFLLPALLCIPVAALSMSLLERQGGLGPRLARLFLFFALSVIAWSVAAAGLFGAVRLLGGTTGLSESLRIFSAGTLSGSLFGMPGGIVLTGGAMIGRLLETGMPENMAIWSILAVRTGTVGLTVLLGVGALIRFRHTLLGLVRGSGAAQQGHFESLSDHYEAQIPAHIRDRLVVTKSDIIVRALERFKTPINGRGLDIGCGQGWYLAHMAKRGFRMAGCDPAAGQVTLARRYCDAREVAADLRVCGAEALEFAPDSFDFAYAINVFHHIIDPKTLAEAFAEAVRVLKPGAPLLIFEMNTQNPLFRFYMSYLFPLLREIDDGTEQWLTPGRLPAIAASRWHPRVDYITFTPDFLPVALMRPAAAIESLLERSPLRHFSAHMMLALIKNETPAST